LSSYYVNELPLPESTYQNSARTSLTAPLDGAACLLSQQEPKSSGHEKTLAKSGNTNQKISKNIQKYPGDLGSGPYQLVQHGNWRTRLEKQRPK
jgi:hypothetical protein